MRAGLQSVLAPATQDAAIIAHLGWVLFLGGAAIFAGVMWLLVRSLRTQPRAVKVRRWIAGGGLLFPVAVLTLLLAYSSWHTARFGAQGSKNALPISVVGKMWWWELRYPDPAGGADIVTANELRIPVGKPVYLGLSTSDVIHAFWVPQLGGKVDMVPGRIHGLRLQADKPGVYRGQCAEYCGEQHARMALHVIALPQAEFDAWLAGQARDAAPPASGTLRRGRDAFLAQRCNACHSVRGVSSGAALGPDLTHVGSRQYIAAGTLRTDQAALAGWIADPQAIKHGARMPGAGSMDGETVRALASWLESLK
ncbi:cytochrome c oxidase subunit II [Massilia endophytica]|uniref:cytochrome c oxidase subunit II n=1 Tax=Massilia endophytica TaxID=2899220 RepID=UPI001E438F23|nr:cytochrome c oxidase subunit II [Massilia endophytica]UGQ48673.1 cytochrome c oxidase subunit II [Massilia endophytica]